MGNITFCDLELLREAAAVPRIQVFYSMCYLVPPITYTKEDNSMVMGRSLASFRTVLLCVVNANSSLSSM